MYQNAFGKASQHSNHVCTHYVSYVSFSDLVHVSSYYSHAWVEFLDWIIKIFKFSAYLAKKYHVINNEWCKIIKPFWCLILKNQTSCFLKLNLLVDAGHF